MSGTPSPPPTPDDAGLVFDDPLDRQSPDSAGIGWGDEGEHRGCGADDLDRFLQEKPPHHL